MLEPRIQSFFDPETFTVTHVVSDPLPSVQVNVRAGRLPPPEDNGVSYLKIPVNTF